MFTRADMKNISTHFFFLKIKNIYCLPGQVKNDLHSLYLFTYFQFSNEEPKFYPIRSNQNTLKNSLKPATVEHPLSSVQITFKNLFV